MATFYNGGDVLNRIESASRAPLDQPRRPGRDRMARFKVRSSRSRSDSAQALSDREAGSQLKQLAAEQIATNSNQLAGLM